MPLSQSPSRSSRSPLLAVLCAGLVAALAMPAAALAATAPAPGHIGGLAVDQLRRPAASATVHLATGGVDAATATSDGRADGRAQAPQGRYDLAVTTPDPTVSAKVRDVDVAADSRLNLELAGNAMQPVHFSGRVVDGAGDPVLPGGVRSAPWRSSTWRRAGRRIQPGPRSRCIWR